MNEFVLPFIYATLGTIGFAMLFEIKPKNIIYCGICGGVGWVVYLIMKNTSHYGDFISNLASALSIVILARFLAKYRKAPAPIFYIPGIFPIVPGAGIYNTAYAVVRNNFADAQNYGLMTIKTSCAIAIAIAIISLFPYSLKRRKVMNQKSFIHKFKSK